MLRNQRRTKRVDYTRIAYIFIYICDWAEKSWNGTSRCEESRKRRFKSKRSEHARGERGRVCVEGPRLGQISISIRGCTMAAVVLPRG